MTLMISSSVSLPWNVGILPPPPVCAELDLPGEDAERVVPSVRGAVQRRRGERPVGLAPPPVGCRSPRAP